MHDIRRRVLLAGALAGAVTGSVAGAVVLDGGRHPALAGSSPAPRATVRTSGRGRTRSWLLDNEALRLRLEFADGSVTVTSLLNKRAGTKGVEYQGRSRGGRRLFEYVLDGGSRVAADDGGWTLLEPSVADLVMHPLHGGTTPVGRELRLPLRRTSPRPLTVTLVVEIYDGGSGLRFFTLVRNDDQAKKTTITESVVFALAAEDRPHTLHYVPNMAWRSTRGALSPLPEDDSSHGKRAELPKKALTVYDAGHGWSVSPELNWKTMRGAGNHDTDYMLPPFASINAWHEIDHVRVATNPESLQLVLFPGEEFEYLSTNLTVFAGDVIDGKMADQEHFRRRFRYNDVTALFNTNDWDYRGGPGRPLPEDYYFTTIIPKAEQAGFDMVMLDDLWNTTRDTIEPNPEMAESIRSLQEFADALQEKGLLFGLWFSLTGAGHAQGRDLADPRQLAHKREQIRTLIEKYHLDHHMIDLTQFWQNEQVTSYSHPSDNVYRKVVLTRQMVNGLVEQYPHYRPKLTTELDIYPTQGDRNNGLLHVTYNGWNTANGGITGEHLSLRTAITGFGHLPMESTYMNQGRLTGRMEDYYSYMAVRNVKFGQDPGNEEYWPEPAIALMAAFNRWRKSPRVRALTEELFRPVHLGEGWDGTEWDSSTGPYVWMYTDAGRRTALVIATAVGSPATRVVADLRWLDERSTYLVADITLDDDGSHTYAYRGTFSGAALRRPGLPLDLLANSSRGQALWIRRAGSGLQLVYADENVTEYTVRSSVRDIRVDLRGEPATTATLIVADPRHDTGLVRTVDLDATGRAAVTIRAEELQPPQRVVFTTLGLELDRTFVLPGTPAAMTATLTVDDFGPVTDVDLTATAPDGWTMTGDPAHADRLATGDALVARWTFTAPTDPTYGFVEIPVVAEYRTGEGPDAARRVAKSARVLLAPDGVDYVSDLPFVSATNGWGPVERDRANGGTQSGDGGPLRIRGTTYDKGLGVHARSEVVVDLSGRYRLFTAQVGIDDSREPFGGGSVVFEVLGDGTSLTRTGVLTVHDPVHPIDVDVTGVRRLTLRVTDAGDGMNNDHADWGDAQLHRVDQGSAGRATTAPVR